MHRVSYVREVVMKILIIGATGLTGQLLVSQCLEKGFDVSILARKIE